MEKLFYDSSESDNGYEIKNKHENCADQNSVKDGIMFKDINKNEYLVGTMPINKSDKFKIDPLPNKNKYTISKVAIDRKRRVLRLYSSTKVKPQNYSKIPPNTAAQCEFSVKIQR